MSDRSSGPERGADDGADAPDVPSDRPSFLATLRAVGWAFFGVRSEQRLFEQDLRRMSPGHVIVIGLLFAAVFIAVLLAIAHLAAGG